jgi:formylglycine-generating enzyme required for sulfatase activity
VTPVARITWFQAQQPCKNSRKRLPSNAEWLLPNAAAQARRRIGTELKPHRQLIIRAGLRRRLEPLS